MNTKKRILLKLTGEVLVSADTGKPDASVLNQIARNIKQLPDHQFGIVVGGGNFFRGAQHGAALGMTEAAGHQVGMLATLMNGTIIKDLCEKQGLAVTMFSAIDCPQVGLPISAQAIHNALAENHIVIFAGGTGNPFFSTDTNAIIRGLQMKAHEVWKGTKVDGVYSSDPRINPDAQRLAHLTPYEALEKRLKIMDATAFMLAAEHNIPIRVFNIFTQDALLYASRDPEYGSLISTNSKVSS